MMFPCVSVSMTSTRFPRSSHTPARSQTVWVLPTPPFKLMTVMALDRYSGAVDTIVMVASPVPARRMILTMSVGTRKPL